jgi:N-acetyl-anhydromuramyl-L-alanine amidase AmpD
MRVPGVPYVQGRNDYPDQDGRKFGMAIHNTSNDASDTEEASYATRRTDGVSSHFYVDNNSVTQSLDTRDKAGHAGSGNGNENSISWEFTGANGKSRQWWLDNIAWDRVGEVMAYLIQNDSDFEDFQVRRASAREMQIDPKVRAFYGHDDMRRAWGGTTHTDPGPNFPWDKLFTSVNRHLEDDVNLTDEVDLPSWAKTEWPTGGTADGKLQVETILGSGYSHARRASERGLGALNQTKANGQVLAKVTAEVAEVKGQVAGLISLVEQLLTAPAVNLTQSQLSELTDAVKAAAREPGERIEAALVAAGQALASVAEPEVEA